MRRTEHALVATVETTATPAELYAAVADLTGLPDWWLWTRPHPRIEAPVHDVRQVRTGGTRAAPCVAVDVVSSGGAVTLLRRMTEKPETRRYTCEVADPHRRVRIRRDTAPSTIGGWSALDLTMEERPVGALLTLRIESTVDGRGPRRALLRALGDHAVKIPESRVRLVAALAGDLDVLDEEQATTWVVREPTRVDGVVPPR